MGSEDKDWSDRLYPQGDEVVVNCDGTPHTIHRSGDANVTLHDCGEHNLEIHWSVRQYGSSARTRESRGDST